MRQMLFLMAVGLLLLGIGGAESAYSATTTASLAAGWNQVCYVGAEGSVEESLGAVVPSVQAIYRFGAGGALDRWFPDRPEVSTIDTLAPEDALLMLVAAPVQWAQSSAGAAPDSAQMTQGWNSICYEGESRRLDEAIGGVEGEVAIAYTLPPGQGWLRFVPGREEISNLVQVEPHQALLVLVSDADGATWHFDEWEIVLPALTPLEPAVEAKAHEIRDTMSSIRGLAVNPTVEEGTITRAALTDYYERQAEQTRQEEGEELRAQNVIYRLLHLMGPQDDLLDIYTGFHSSAVLGFYVPSDDELVLVAEEAAAIGMENESTLAHEYVHSFQDARFDIDKLDELAQNEEDTHSNTEYGTTVSCLIEGDARLSEMTYMVTVYGLDWLLDPIASAESQVAADVPPGLIRYFYFPYAQCADFVGFLFLTGGWDAVNGVYDDVPTSTEQILDPAKYTSHEAPAALSLADLSGPLGQGWTQLDDAVFGEFDVYNYLLSSLEGQSGWDEVAQEAAAGWGGGRMAAYAHEDGTRVALHLSLQWDTPDDLSQFVDAFLRVAGTTAGHWWPADPSITTVRWDGAAEHGFATWQGGSFVAILSPSADDLRTAATAAGYDLDAATGPSLPAPP